MKNYKPNIEKILGLIPIGTGKTEEIHRELERLIIKVERNTKTSQSLYTQALEDLHSCLDDDSCECDNCGRTRNFMKNPIKELHKTQQKEWAKNNY